MTDVKSRKKDTRDLPREKHPSKKQGPHTTHHPSHQSPIKKEINEDEYFNLYESHSLMSMLKFNKRYQQPSKIGVYL